MPLADNLLTEQLYQQRLSQQLAKSFVTERFDIWSKPSSDYLQNDSLEQLYKERLHNSSSRGFPLSGST
jgi:phage terminase large subunit-like protein